MNRTNNIVMTSLVLPLSSAAGPLDWIVGWIIALIGGACISILVTMFIMGYQKKGFTIGWKVHHIFNWEWYCGETS